MSWISDLVDWGGSALGYEDVTSGWPDITGSEAWSYLMDKPDSVGLSGERPGGWQGFAGSLFSPSSLIGGATAIGQYWLKQQGQEGGDSAYVDYLNRKLTSDEELTRQKLEQDAAAEAAAAEMAAAQLEYQKQLAAYRGKLESAGHRADVALSGGLGTAGAYSTLAEIAQRPALSVRRGI